jgi:hypothetical protein
MLTLASKFFAMAMLAKAPAAHSSLIVEDCNFGEAYAFNRVECEVTLLNAGDAPIRVSDIRAQDAGDEAKISAALIAPHSKQYLSLVADTQNGIGNVRHLFNFQTDEKGHEKRLAVARGFVTTVLDDARPAFNFGVVDLSVPLLAKHLELTSHDVANFRIEKVISAPEYVDVTLGTDGRSLDAKVRAGAPWGFRIGYIKLATNSLVQKEVWVGVQADLHGAVVASSNPLNVGLMRTGSRNEHLIRLTRRDGKAFRVGKVAVEGFKAGSDVLPCIPAKQGCQLLKLTIADDQTLGTIKGDVDVAFPDDGKSMRIAVWGLLIDKDTQIEKLDSADLAKSSKAGAGATSAASSKVDIKNAIKEVVAAAEETDPPGKGPLLKWTVANEELIHGYQIFRGPDEAGPFLLVNKEMLPRKSTPANPNAVYKWRDNSAETGKTYWYYIGMVYNDGRKQELTGPQRVVAK